ncbi:Protein of unknown function DUF3527 [Dillenia turbinata]|uniref:Uncharacterized protein n=1 Tax=Dillenia turbinata TaxID=194707 RepID=A0AAN8VBH4_9MAGN
MDHCYVEDKNDSWDLHHSEAGKKISPPKAQERLKLNDRLKLEKSLSYADFHHEIKKSEVDILSKPLGVPQRLRVEKKDVKDDELVKYMSNLPSYLERGGNLKDKPLNVGVLDWGRLEKWQYKQKQVPSRTRRHSISSSYTSSFSSTAGSSTHSSGGQSCSPSNQRIQCRPTLRSHFMAAPRGSNSQSASSFGGNHGDLQNWNADAEQPFGRTNQSFHEKNAETKPEHLNGSALDSKMTGTSRSSENCVVASRWKLKKKDQAVEYTKRAGNLQEPISDHVDLDGCDAKGTVILLRPKDSPGSNHVGVSHFSDMTAAECRESAEVTQRSLPERYISDEVCDVPYFDILCSGPLRSGVGGINHLDTKQSSSIESPLGQHGKVDTHIPSVCLPLSAANSSRKNKTQSLKFSSDATCPLPHSAESQISPIRSRTSGEKKCTIMSATSALDKHYDGLHQKSQSVSVEKVRSPSPTRSFSFRMARVGRTSISKEGSTVPQLNSTLNTVKSFLPGVQPSAHLEDSSDRANASRRAMSSPLRRLLGPIWKPKMANCHQSGKPLANDGTSACKSSDGRLDSSSVHPMKTKLSFTSCKSAEVNDAHQDEKHKSTTMQALLQVAVKNGLPLFTFAVDSNTDILAATMRLPSNSTNDYFSWIYTFFMVREIKKKSGGWMNQGNKGKGHGYIPDLVAEMRVSGHEFDGSTSHSSSVFSVREFVLFAVDKKQTDEQKLEFHRSTEIAAIVTKSLREDGRQKNDYNGLPEIFQKDCLSEESCYSHYGENAKDGPSMGHQVPLGMTVVLPSGVHGVPDEGHPPSLIERWISGGSCDCGGWDLGCKLRIFATQNKKPTSRTVCPTVNQFELFAQEGVEENQLVFSLGSFKDNVYSVQYSSAILPLQAFSICIAILHSRRQYETLEMKKLWQEMTSDDMIFEEDYGTKDPGNEEIPARYISYPPHSPVGRV